MAFNQRSHDSPVMMAYGQVAIDSVLYGERALKGGNDCKKAKGSRPDQAASGEELNASPARQLKAISRKLAGSYEEKGRKIGGRVGAVGGAIAGGAAFGAGGALIGAAAGGAGAPIVASVGAVSGAIMGGTAGRGAGQRLGAKIDDKTPELPRAKTTRVVLLTDQTRLNLADKTVVALADKTPLPSALSTRFYDLASPDTVLKPLNLGFVVASAEDMHRGGST
ncbi:hypothetical protein LEN26_007002 [Aphanomyces euteiches]|nr:hypothetical protein LEN26_007002 [Aphanomyces euteiches]